MSSPRPTLESLGAQLYQLIVELANAPSLLYLAATQLCANLRCSVDAFEARPSGEGYAHLLLNWILLRSFLRAAVLGPDPESSDYLLLAATHRDLGPLVDAVLVAATELLRNHQRYWSTDIVSPLMRSVYDGALPISSTLELADGLRRLTCEPTG